MTIAIIVLSINHYIRPIIATDALFFLRFDVGLTITSFSEK